MRKQIEGSVAVAEAVALCRPEVISAYPITPQTHIVEALGRMVKSGQLPRCEFINAESEFAAMSIVIGASSAGARTYTATASQGLLYMSEAVYNASGLGLPIVMTIGNRAIGAPINIWNDQSDSMALRDAGWIQLYAHSNQHAVDLHLLAFRLAEQISLPVMVCMDGFILTHAVEGVDIPSQNEVDKFLPQFTPRQVLDPDAPLAIGSMVGPEAFTEVRYLAHLQQMDTLELLPQLETSFEDNFGRNPHPLMRTYHIDDADTTIITLGSVFGTLQDVVDEFRQEGLRLGLIALTSYRPFPVNTLQNVLRDTKRVITLEKSLAVGMGGILAADVAAAIQTSCDKYAVIAGLGGRAITKRSLRQMIRDAYQDDLGALTFLDLDEKSIATHLIPVESNGHRKEAI